MKGIRLFLWMFFLTGIAYPLTVTGISQLFFKKKAEGSFIFKEGKPLGSLLIGQPFTQERYFWPRPSSGDYNPLPSQASHLSPTSALLKKEFDARLSRVLQQGGKKKVPSELLFASASGLDPHISLATAYFQAERVAKSRGIEIEKIVAVIDSLVEKRQLGFLGHPKVNVLKLNLALDVLSTIPKAQDERGRETRP